MHPLGGQFYILAGFSPSFQCTYLIGMGHAVVTVRGLDGQASPRQNCPLRNTWLMTVMCCQVRGGWGAEPLARWHEGCNTGISATYIVYLLRLI
jgi:hypothetical protein